MAPVPVTIRKGGQEAVSAASILSVLTLGAAQGDEVVLTAEGEGAEGVLDALAELEGLAQPTMTLLVQRLEQRGWVTRERRAEDGRVVLVSLTEAGSATLDAFRAQVGAALRVYMDAMSDEQIAALETATEALGSLVDTFLSDA